jgi:hypothetical protein
MNSDKWIQPTMDLKKLGTDPNKIITVQNSGVLETDFYKYANNFHEAADIILRELIGPDSESSIAKLDTWYFALIYLYRQSLELMLKANIFKLVQNEQDRKDTIASVRHDVGAGFDKIIDLQGIDINSNQNIKWLSDFLHDISKIDRESDMFRYPFGSNLRVLFQDQTQISLPATYYNMSRAFHALEGFYQTQQFTKGDYPEYEPKLIVEGGEYYQSSVVGYKYHTRSFHPYYTSYEECAKYLTAYIKRTGKDHLFMPMCYLYRNAIELGLKRIIIEDSSTIDTEKALKICKKKKHSILGLYNSIKPELDAHDNGTDTTLEDVYKYINSFHDIDTTSDKFRYPCDNDLNVHFKDSTKLDIDNVASCFEELITFLDGASHMLSVEKEIAAEAAAEAASWSI